MVTRRSSNRRSTRRKSVSIQSRKSNRQSPRRQSPNRRKSPSRKSPSAKSHKRRKSNWRKVRSDTPYPHPYPYPSNQSRLIRSPRQQLPQQYLSEQKPNPYSDMNVYGGGGFGGGDFGGGGGIAPVIKKTNSKPSNKKESPKPQQTSEPPQTSVQSPTKKESPKSDLLAALQSSSAKSPEISRLQNDMDNAKEKVEECRKKAAEVLADIINLASDISAKASSKVINEAAKKVEEATKEKAKIEASTMVAIQKATELGEEISVGSASDIRDAIIDKEELSDEEQLANMIKILEVLKINLSAFDFSPSLFTKIIREIKNYNNKLCISGLGENKTIELDINAENFKFRNNKGKIIKNISEMKQYLTECNKSKLNFAIHQFTVRTKITPSNAIFENTIILHRKTSKQLYIICAKDELISENFSMIAEKLQNLFTDNSIQINNVVKLEYDYDSPIILSKKDVLTKKQFNNILPIVFTDYYTSFSGSPENIELEKDYEKQLFYAFIFQPLNLVNVLKAVFRTLIQTNGQSYIEQLIKDDPDMKDIDVFIIRNSQQSIDKFPNIKGFKETLLKSKLKVADISLETSRYQKFCKKYSINKDLCYNEPQIIWNQDKPQNAGLSLSLKTIFKAGAAMGVLLLLYYVTRRSGVGQTIGQQANETNPLEQFGEFPELNQGLDQSDMRSFINNLQRDEPILEKITDTQPLPDKTDELQPTSLQRISNSARRFYNYITGNVKKTIDNIYSIINVNDRKGLETVFNQTAELYTKDPRFEDYRSRVSASFRVLVLNLYTPNRADKATVISLFILNNKDAERITDTISRDNHVVIIDGKEVSTETDPTEQQSKIRKATLAGTIAARKLGRQPVFIITNTENIDKYTYPVFLHLWKEGGSVTVGSANEPMKGSVFIILFPITVSELKNIPENGPGSASSKKHIVENFIKPPKIDVENRIEHEAGPVAITRRVSHYYAFLTQETSDNLPDFSFNS